MVSGQSGLPKGYLAIMGREPDSPGIKTRLCPPFSLREAGSLYRAMLLDTIDVAASLEGVAAGVAYTPASAVDRFRRIVPPAFFLVPQGDGELGERLEGVARSLFAQGAGCVCLMNSDGPDLPREHLIEAFARLQRGDQVVFGPNPDGGYYLVGLRNPAGIFGGIPWSTGEVLEKSLALAGRLGLSCGLLPPWPDLDTPVDLGHALVRWGAGGGPPRTAPLLRRLAARKGIRPGWST